MICDHCKRNIRQSPDPNVPWVHNATGNAYCDVTDAEVAVGSTWANPFGVRTTAEPDLVDAAIEDYLDDQMTWPNGGW